jgi:hypothetical protein
VTLQARLVGDEALRVVADGFELDVDLNWYRSLPLSSVAVLELAVHGENVSADEITFAVNGNEYLLDELADRWDEYWFVLDPATLRVRRPLVPRGESVEVRVRLGVRIPYLPIGPTQAVVYVSESVRTLTAC